MDTLYVYSSISDFVKVGSAEEKKILACNVFYLSNHCFDVKHCLLILIGCT